MTDEIFCPHCDKAIGLAGWTKPSEAHELRAALAAAEERARRVEVARRTPPPATAEMLHYWYGLAMVSSDMWDDDLIGRVDRFLADWGYSMSNPPPTTTPGAGPGGGGGDQQGEG